MISTLLADLATDGWLINNCYQSDATLWRLNLRRPDPSGESTSFTSWVEAPTFLEALEEAMSSYATAESFPDPTITFTTDLTPPPPKPSAQSLLSLLGLKPKLIRRI